MCASQPQQEKTHPSFLPSCVLCWGCWSLNLHLHTLLWCLTLLAKLSGETRGIFLPVLFWLDIYPSSSSCSCLSYTFSARSVAFICSDEVEIPSEVRPPDQYVDDTPYFPRAQPARAARIEHSTFRYAHWQTLRTFKAYDSAFIMTQTA